MIAYREFDAVVRDALDLITRQGAVTSLDLLWSLAGTHPEIAGFRDVFMERLAATAARTGTARRDGDTWHAVHPFTTGEYGAAAVQ